MRSYILSYTKILLLTCLSLELSAAAVPAALDREQEARFSTMASDYGVPPARLDAVVEQSKRLLGGTFQVICAHDSSYYGTLAPQLVMTLKNQAPENLAHFVDNALALKLPPVSPAACGLIQDYVIAVQHLGLLSLPEQDAFAAAAAKVPAPDRMEPFVLPIFRGILASCFEAPSATGVRAFKKPAQSWEQLILAARISEVLKAETRGGTFHWRGKEIPVKEQDSAAIVDGVLPSVSVGDCRKSLANGITLHLL